jgi:hypothetical protein
VRKVYTIQLDEHDLGQLLDGLEIRAESWERTAKYLRTERMPDDDMFVVEECRRGRCHRRALPRYHQPYSSANGRPSMSRKGFCVFIDTLLQGPTPLVRDGDNYPFVFESQFEAEREIADYMITRLQHSWKANATSTMRSPLKNTSWKSKFGLMGE